MSTGKSILIERIPLKNILVSHFYKLHSIVRCVLYMCVISYKTREGGFARLIWQLYLSKRNIT